MNNFYTFETDIGTLTLITDGQALTRVIFGTDTGKTEARYFCDDVIHDAHCQINEYLSGSRRSFTIPYKVDGTAFQRAVWDALLHIPYGTTRTYGELARAVGSPGGARAVGGANHSNPLPIIIPCHRVVAANSIGGYGGGLAIKRRLLSIEGIRGEGIRGEGIRGFLERKPGKEL